MKAVHIAGPKKLAVIETDKPVPDGQSIIIQVTRCGICGSDLHFWENGVGMDGKPGLVMGHEFAGRIEHNGGRKDLRPGDRVTVIPINPCEECEFCKNGLAQMCRNLTKRPQIGLSGPGAYAQFIAVRPDMVRRLPDTVSDDAAAMIEPSAVSLHAVQTAGIRNGEKVLIVGAGAIGLLCAAWARINGAGWIGISEVSETRREAAAAQGDADRILDARNPEILREIRKAATGGVDVAIDASASDAGINTALMTLKGGGRLVLAGISLKPQSIATLLITARELNIKGTFGYRIADFEAAAQAIADGKLHAAKYVSGVVGLDEIQQAFEALHSGRAGDVKILIDPER